MVKNSSLPSFASSSIAAAYPRGEWGSGLATFQKVGPRDSHKNVIKLVGGGESGRSLKNWSLKFLKSKQRVVFQELVTRFWFLRNA